MHCKARRRPTRCWCRAGCGRGAIRRISRFIELNDGSSLRNLQIIARDTLAELRRGAAPDHRRVNRACAARSSPRRAKGKAGKLVADEIEIIGALGRKSIRSRKRATPRSSCARSLTCGRARILFGCVFRVRSRLAFADPPVFPGARLRLRAHADHHRERLRRRRRVVPRHARSTRRSRRACLTTAAIDYAQDFFARPDLSHGQRPARGGSFRLRALQGLHLRADFPRGEFQHFAARQRVLDDRAGNGFLRSARATWTWPRRW